MTATTLTFTDENSTNTDALYRAKCSAISAALDAIGLTQTSDTGQINLATAVRPTTSNTKGHYQIRQWADSQMGSAPVYFRIEFGNSASSSSSFGLWWNAGQSTDGAGNLGGTLFVNNHGVANTASAGYNANYFFCRKDGWFFFGKYLQSGTTFSTASAICLARSVDINGNPTADAIYQGFHNPVGLNAANAFTTNTWQILTPTTTNLLGAGNTASSTLIPFGVTSVAVGVDTQAFIHWMPTPKVCPVPYLLTIQTNAAALASTFSLAPLGSTSRTFLSWNGYISGYGSNANYTLAFMFD